MKFRPVILKCSLFFLFWLLLQNFVSGQTRESLEKERMDIIEQIDNTGRILETTNKNKIDNIQALELIQSQIKNRKRIIENIQQSILLSEAQITTENQKRSRLSQQHLALIKDYNSVVRMSYKKLLTANSLVYLLSASDWDQSWQRLQYSKSLEHHLQRQLTALNESAKLLQASIGKIEMEKQQQIELLMAEKKNYAQLEREEKIKDDILYQLQGDEKRLKGALIKQRRDREELNRAIEKVIIKALGVVEMNDHSNTNEKKDPENRSTRQFELNKGQLPWPVKNASVISSFGKQKHPTLENVYIQNNGIDMVGSKDAQVFAVFDGLIAEVMQIPGSDQMVIIKHGDYYTVYSRLKNVLISKGDRILKGDSIGLLGSDNGTLHFEIWFDKQKLNPRDWIR